MRALFLACAALALVVIGALLPRAQGRLDTGSLSPAPVAHAAPWPAWAHGEHNVAVAAPSPHQQPSSSMAVPTSAEKQSAGEHTGITDSASAVAAPGWRHQALRLMAASLTGRALPVLPPPPRSA